MRRSIPAIAMLSAVMPLEAHATSYSCGGAEPFWSMDISESAISYQSASFESKFNLDPVTPDSARGAASDYVLVYRTHIVNAPSEPVTIVLQRSLESKCSDSMSEPNYPFYIVMITRRNVLSGCCVANPE